MALVLHKKSKEYEYIPVEERGTEKPVKFIFKPLRKSQQAKLEDNVMKFDPTGSTITLANASLVLNSIKIGLKKVENVTDEDGKEVKVKFDGDVVADSFLEMFPDNILQELGNVIIAVSKDPQNASKYLGEG